MNEQPHCLLCIPWWELGIQICFLPRLGIKSRSPKPVCSPTSLKEMPSHLKLSHALLCGRVPSGYRCGVNLDSFQASAAFYTMSFTSELALRKAFPSLCVQCLVSKVWFLKTVIPSQEEFLYLLFL